MGLLQHVAILPISLRIRCAAWKLCILHLTVLEILLLNQLLTRHASHAHSPHLDSATKMPLFTRKHHVNTLAPLEPGKLWAVLNNLGNVSRWKEGDILDRCTMAWCRNMWGIMARMNV